jgi:hypothetical protein
MLAFSRMQKSASLTTAASRTVPTPAKAAVGRGRDLGAAAFTRSGTFAQDARSSSLTAVRPAMGGVPDVL